MAHKLIELLFVYIDFVANEDTIVASYIAFNLHFRENVKSDYNNLSSLLTTLPDKTVHNIMVKSSCSCLFFYNAFVVSGRLISSANFTCY